MIIDVHGHYTTPQQMARFPVPPILADIPGMIEKKAAAGIDLTILGSPIGGGSMMRVPGFDNYAQTADEIRASNEWLAEVVARHPDRLRAYAYTNPFGGDAMMADAAETVRSGGFVGLIVNTSVRGRYLDAPEAKPFFEMAGDLGLPVLLHPPAEPVGSAALADFRLVEQVVRFTDVTAGLAVLACSGRLQQHPTIPFISATAGGAISLLADVLDRHATHLDGEEPGRSPGDALRQVYVDTTNANREHHLANLKVFGTDRMLFGTDAPPLFAPLEGAIAQVRDLPVGAGETAAILGGNAARLFHLAGQPADR